jgi:hypothetical protein
VLPVSIYNYQSNGTADTFAGAIGFKATKADGVTEAGRVSHPKDQNGYSAPVVRSLVVGDRLFTISTAGMLASDLSSFADKGFVAFPAPPPVVQPDAGTVTSPPAK